MQHILIVKTSAIGDVLQTLPVLAYLKHLFPQTEIDWVVERPCSDLLLAHPLLTSVYVVDTKKWRKQAGVYCLEIKNFIYDLRKKEYDLLFDLQGNCKSALITFCAKAKEKVGFGWQSVSEWPNLLATHKRYNIDLTINVRDRYLDLVRQHMGRREHLPFPWSFKLNDNETKRLEEILAEGQLKKLKLMVAFGSKWKNKQLSEPMLQKLLTTLSEKYPVSFLFPFGNAEEEKLARTLETLFPDRSLALGQLSLPLWQRLMEHVHGVIAMDSAALHLCATTKTPTFSFFGPSKASIFKPLGEEHSAFQGACPYDQIFTERCSKLRSCPTGACLREVSFESLFEPLDQWVKIISCSEHLRER